MTDLSKKKLKPLHDRIVAERLTEEKSCTDSTIVIPDTAKEKPILAKVKAVGPGKVLDKGDIRPLAVKMGDTILFGKYAGTEVKLDGKDYLVLREDDVMAIVEEA